MNTICGKRIYVRKTFGLNGVSTKNNTLIEKEKPTHITHEQE